jgi:hypothetical protein
MNVSGATPTGRLLGRFVMRNKTKAENVRYLRIDDAEVGTELCWEQPFSHVMTWRRYRAALCTTEGRLGEHRHKIGEFKGHYVPLVGFMSVSNPHNANHVPDVEPEDHTRERLEPMVANRLHKVVLGYGD